jgi:hypothetical protein
MLAGIAFVPSAPLLLPDLGGGPEDLRSACRQAISALGDVDDLVVLGAASPAGWRTGFIDATAYGAPGPPSRQPLPLPLAVGSALVGERTHLLLAVAGDAVAVERRTGLVVVGDGSAKRTEKAPGHYDPRAGAFDASVASALAAGAPQALLDLDAALAEELMVGGLTAWRSAAATALGADWTGSVLYADAPYGVGYLVATWTPVGSPT